MVLLLLLPTGKVSLEVSVPLKAGDSCPPSQHRSRQLAHCPPPPPGLWESILKLYDIDWVASHRKPVHILARVLSGMVCEFLLSNPGTCITSVGTPAFAQPRGNGTCYHQQYSKDTVEDHIFLLVVSFLWVLCESVIVSSGIICLADAGEVLVENHILYPAANIHMGRPRDP